MVVSDSVTGTVTMRLEDVTAIQAISIIVKAKGLFMDKIENVYYIKTPAEKTAEPTESDSYQFSYARAKDVSPLIASQLQSKIAPQIDERTNTMFFSETRSNIDSIRKVLVQIDKPTRQVMINAVIGVYIPRYRNGALLVLALALAGGVWWTRRRRRR